MSGHSSNLKGSHPSLSIVLRLRKTAQAAQNIVLCYGMVTYQELEWAGKLVRQRQ